MAASDIARTPVVVQRGRDEPQWQGVPLGSDTLFLLTANGPPIRPPQWHWDYDPPPVWLADPVPTNIRTFPVATPVVNLWQQWTYDVAPPWQGVPEAANYLLLGGQVGTKQWRSDLALDPVWTWRPPPNEPLYQPVGKPFGKQWRADFDVDTRSWEWEPANVTIGLPVPSLQGAGAIFAQDADPDTRLWQWRPPPVASIPAAAKPFSRQWRWDLTPDTAWTWPSQPTDTLYLLTAGGKPFSRQWRYDHVPDPVWLGGPQPSNIGTFPASVKPFSRLSRFHYAVDQEPAWLGVPVASPFELPSAPPTLTGPAQAPFYVPRGDPAPPWQGKSQAANIGTLPAAAPFSKLWRYDYTPEPAWVWKAPPDWSLVLPTVVPFFRLWRWDHQPEPPWTGKPQASSTLPAFTAGGEPFARFWRYDYVSDPVWPGEPQPTNIGTLPAPIITGPAQSPFYVPRGDPAPPWQGEPQPSNIGTFPVSVKPFGKWWAWNHVPDPVWLGEPQAANIGTLPTAGTPFSRQWRYDYVPDALWLGEPVAVPIETFPAAATPFSRLWRYDLTPSPDWTWQPAASGALRALTAGGAPTFRQWRYDYDSGATFWQGVPLVTNITTLVQTAPFHQQWRYDWDSGRSWWQGAPIGVNVPIANPGPPVPVVPPTTGAGGELPPGYRWRWTDFNDRAWLKAFREEFYRLRRLKNPERRRRQFEVLEQKFIGAAERALEYETPYEKKLDLVQLGELLQGFATPASFDRIEMYLVALAAEIDDEEAFLLLND